MLKGLSRWLRLLGFQTKVISDISEFQQIQQDVPSAIFLTASRRHFQKIEKNQALLLKDESLEKQLRELDDAFHLFDRIEFLTVCTKCGVETESIEKKQIGDRIPVKVRESFAEFRQCPRCKRIYWKGGHVERMIRKLKRLKVPLDPSAYLEK